MPQTTAVFPILTAADPSAVCIVFKFSDASRKFINSLPSFLLLSAYSNVAIVFNTCIKAIDFTEWKYTYKIFLGVCVLYISEK